MKYSQYIELSTHYESVVDLDAEERNPSLWQEYIVHGDMQRAVEAICQTMLWEDKDKRRSFWIHGAYGTGKSYAAIVLKHLFEDAPQGIDAFLSRSMLAEYKKRFMKIREKGNFLVVWKSGTTGIRNGTQMMMEMEVAINAKLKQRFGDKAYYGSNSLISAAKEAIEDPSIDWLHLFNKSNYGLNEHYASFEAFRRAVMLGEMDAISLVRVVCEGIQRSMFTGVVDRFETWLKDIIAGNGLQDTGIVFIWDEFTSFLRDCGDDNVLQRLSEFCKQPGAPFFMCLIVHRDPTWVAEFGNETYERILHRYHKLEFHISESAAYDLIGNSIIPRSGFEQEWKAVKQSLVKSLDKYKHEFDNLDQSANLSDRLMSLCPIHPMTLVMLATVAQNFGASQRTLFRFMKDRSEAAEGVGFVHFIENNEPDKWQWLTVDFLWDYFFMRGSDMQSFDAEARKVILHFQNHKDAISDENFLHVFKAAMLLIAVMGGSNMSISHLNSRQNRSATRVTSTRNTLYKCFRGQLDQATIDEALRAFMDTGMLSMAEQQNGDARLELPYTGNTSTFEVRFDAVKKRYTRHALLGDKGEFATALESALWDSTRATFRRVSIAVCAADNASLNTRVGQLKKDLERYSYKIGLLAVVVSEAKDFNEAQARMKQVAAEDTSGRLVVLVLREALTSTIIENWHKAIAHKELCAEDAKKADEARYANEASVIVATWAQATVASAMMVFYREVQFANIHGYSDMMKRVENDVLYKVFPAAPERLILTNTAFNRASSAAIKAGLTQSTGNSQLNSVINALKSVGVWESKSLLELGQAKGDGAEVINLLADALQQVFAQGSNIPLDDLWVRLQNPPFGYTNSLAVGCILGTALRFLVNSSYNWFDGTNTFPSTESVVEGMIGKILEGKVINNNLSSGSDAWKRFQPYIKVLFGLADVEAVNETEARKYIRQAIISKIGVPIWALKYVPAEHVGGSEQLRIAAQVADLLCHFTFEAEDHDNTMNEVLQCFKGNGQLRQKMVEVLNNKALMFQGFKGFVFTKVMTMEGMYAELDLTDMDLFTALRSYLQDSIYTWREEQVGAKATELTAELKLIATVQREIGIPMKTFHAMQRTLRDVFGLMKVPGSVLETLQFPWVPALRMLRSISLALNWAELEHKENAAKVVAEGAKDAWENITHSVVLLEVLLHARGATITEIELSDIYANLRTVSYDNPKADFDARLNSLLDDVQYNRDMALALQLWITVSSTDSVRAWCNQANVPITWLFDISQHSALRALDSVQQGNRLAVGSAMLKEVLHFLQAGNLAVLNDATLWEKAFFEHVGEEYRSAFATDRGTLISRLKTNPRVSGEVYTWDGKIPAMRETLDAYMQKVYQQEAVDRVKTMNDAELRAAVLRLLEKNPGLYSNFLK